MTFHQRVNKKLILCLLEKKWNYRNGKWEKNCLHSKLNARENHADHNYIMQAVQVVEFSLYFGSKQMHLNQYNNHISIQPTIIV